ncbi:Dolichyl-diphosphooligosaccharide--protein glycosyltransferase subunit 1 [Nymphon striatum]|nr:Dolichyl-diphosphooligosaccharide--protein glycosyltransferase subunit 1 [Nymphon striatum]
MDSFIYKLAFLICTCATLCISQQYSVNQGIVFKKVDREVDLITQLVRIKSKITLENTGKSAVKSFLYSVEPEIAEKLAWISANMNADKKQLDMKKVDITKYSITLDSAVEAGKSVVVNVELTYTHHLIPFPSQITQSEKQSVLYNGNHYLYTPYLTRSQTTTIKLPANKIESYSKTKKPVSSSDSILTYGPYEKAEPFSIEKLKVHYENNNQFLAVTKLERVIEISHWGNIAVEEKIYVRHNGAVLKGSFSRYEYQTEHSGVSAIKGYKTILPAAASDVYYRDEIGNISTSHLRTLDDSVELELRPRFPLFGGWKTQYTIGYNLPSYEYLFSSGSQFALKMRFIDHIYDENVIDEATVKIILPEGCADIKLNIPYPVKRDNNGLHYTYLDTTGRPLLTAHKSNLVENHIQDFQLNYTFERVLMFQEPLLVVVALYLFFICIIIFVRMDFSISQDEAVESKLKVSSYCSQIVSHQEKRDEIYEKYADILQKYKLSKDENSFTNSLKKLNNEHKVATQAIADMMTKVKNESGDTADKIAELQKLDRNMKEQLTQQVNLSERLVHSKLSKSNFIDSEKAIIKRKEELLDKIETITSHL